MKLPHTIAYAIHAISRLALAPPGVPVPCSQLAREGQMPERFLLQILRKLVNHGVLESTCGVAGGYYLSRPPQQIELSEVMEAIDNTLEFSMPTLECMSAVVRAHIIEAMQNASYAAIASFRHETVADLIGGAVPELQNETPHPKPQERSARAVGALEPVVLPPIAVPVTR
jgi:Rrf2 family transcriptional regulator, cysteine metabolism repressor